MRASGQLITKLGCFGVKWKIESLQVNSTITLNITKIVKKKKRKEGSLTLGCKLYFGLNGL